MKKHSYRVLDKRRFASWVLFYLQDTEDAKTLDFKTMPIIKDRERIKYAFEVAEGLKKEGIRANLSQYAPYKNEIRKLLTAEKRNIQLELI